MKLVQNILVLLEPDNHSEEDELERYSMGDVGSDECARLEEHLLLCETCRERLNAHDAFTRSMADAAADWRAEHRNAERGRWPFLRLAAAMGSLAILAGSALWLERSSPQNIMPPLAVVLSTNRGATLAAHAPALRRLELKPDLTGIAPFPVYELQVVDVAGAEVAKARTTSQESIRISALPSGTYFARLYSPAGELLREYALQVR